MNAVRHFLSTLSVYTYPQHYLNTTIVLFLLLASYIYSFLFIRKETAATITARMLTGSVVLINIGWLLLLAHSISAPVILITLIVSAALVMILGKISPAYLLGQFRAAFRPGTGRIYTIIYILVFLLLLPKAYNGFFRWDEVSYHLAYPQFWINSGGFEVDYSMRYPVYSFGLHIIYTILLTLGSVATVKLYTGFFLLFFFFGIKEICGLFRLPSYYNLLLVLLLLLVDYFSEWSFTTMLEPVLWTYALFAAIEIYKTSFDEIFAGRFKSSVPAILLIAMLVCIKNFFIVYFGLFFIILALIRWRRVINDRGNFLKWTGFVFLLVFATNLINFVIAFMYSGDPVFPLLTMNMPDHFTALLSLEDVKGLKESVNKTNGGVAAAFNPNVLSKLFLATTALCIIALAVLFFANFKSKSNNRHDITILAWLLLSLLLTQVLFPDFTRYSYFLLPALIFCLGFLYKYSGKIMLHAAFAIVILAYVRPHTLVDSAKYYLLPFRQQNIDDIDIERVVFGDADLMDMFDYLHRHKEIDTVSACNVHQFRYILLRDNKTVYGDNVGKYRIGQLCNCTNAIGYMFAPKNMGYTTQGCDIVYENNGYMLLKGR